MKVKKLLRKHVFFVIIFFLLLLYLGVMGYAAYNHTQTERFGDETAQMVGGHLLLEGKVLYENLQFNHQPLNYIFSAIAEKLTHPSNLYFYIARQREAVFLYAAFWNIVYLFSFGPIMFLFSIIFEFIKYNFQGYKLLGETLATYPLIFLFGLTTEIFLFKRKPSKILLIVFSIASFIIVFSLLPLLLVVGLLVLPILYSLRKTRYLIIYLILPFLILTILLAFFVPFPSLIRETVIYNIKYFLPNSGGHVSFFKMLIIPLVSLLPPYGPAKTLVGLFVIFTLTSLVIAKEKKRLAQSLFILLAITLCNFFRVDEFSFGNFHLLPWVAALFITETVWIKNNTSKIKVGILVVTLVFVYLTVKNTLFTKRNLTEDYYINYSDSETYGKALKILKSPTDRLIVMPNDTIIYLVSGIIPPTRVLEYYSWVYYIPEYKKELMKVMTDNSPEFMIDTGLNNQNPTEKYIIDLLNTKYQRLFHTGTPSRLYILKDRIPSINQAQRNDLNSMLFSEF